MPSLRNLLASTFLFGQMVMASPEIWASENWTGDPRPLTAEDWSYERAAHLLERLGFGGTPREIEELANVTPRIAVDFLLNYHLIDNTAVPPFDESNIFDPGMEPFPRSRAEAVKIARENGEAMGVSVKPSGDRPYQHIVNKYFIILGQIALKTIA